jgi:hypothetical protein
MVVEDVPVCVPSLYGTYVRLFLLVEGETIILYSYSCTVRYGDSGLSPTLCHFLNVESTVQYSDTLGYQGIKDR